MEMRRTVLFVCLGNICRSPAAEGVMQRMLAERGFEGQIQVDSAGTIGIHAGRAADSRMIAAAAERGYELTSKSRQIVRQDITAFDLIIAMDRENYHNIMKLSPGVATHVRMLSDYLDDDWPRDVPDPYYGGSEGFATVLDMLETACPRIIEDLIVQS